METEHTLWFVVIAGENSLSRVSSIGRNCTKHFFIPLYILLKIYIKLLL
jgi:hypothetical protein